jgi:hypothetical protein
MSADLKGPPYIGLPDPRSHSRLNALNTQKKTISILRFPRLLR